jgi:hypothetical protein
VPIRLSQLFVGSVAVKYESEFLYWLKAVKAIKLRYKPIRTTEVLFPKPYNMVQIRRFVPFDLVATYKSERVLIDGTTRRCKSGYHAKTAIEFAKALRMRLFILFIKPDFSMCHIRDAADGYHSMLKELRPLP